MDVTLLPLLKVQRELLLEPLGFGRFQRYLKTMVGEDGDLALPLSGFNPMSKGHVSELLDKLIAMDAEAIASDALRESVDELSRVRGLRGMPPYRFGLVVVDDARGGWTNRYLFEAKDRFENQYGLRNGFITALLWSSEEPSAERVREETAGAIFRTAWLWAHGLPDTLGQMLRQEGMVTRFSRTGSGHETEKRLIDTIAADLVKKNLDSTHYPTIMSCLYGDEAAVSLGYEPFGMAENGGLRYAVSDEFLGKDDPVDVLQRGVNEDAQIP